MTFANIFFPRNIFAERGAREDADIDLESFSFSARVGDTFSMMGPLPGFWNAVRRLLWMAGDALEARIGEDRFEALLDEIDGNLYA